MFRALTPFGRLVVIATVLAVAGSLFLVLKPEGGTPAQRFEVGDRTFDSNDPIERACALPERELLRIWRGHDPAHSEDITIVPQPPNYSGSFGTTSHSGPWDYVQTVPLVLYGPGIIRTAGQIEDDANITDVYPTAGKLSGVDLPARDGRVLDEALVEDASPRLIVTVMWDGVGRNVLERWSGRWPNLARLEREGTSYVRATVGSSPSITPATHASLGTGTYPRRHGVTAIEMRRPDGSMKTAFAGKNPADLKLTTFADEIDRALDNAPKVGMLAWKSWHMGMMGHGAATPGGDRDELAIISSSIVSNTSLYALPGYMVGRPGPEERAEELDIEDGEADSEWRGHPILEDHDNPAWVRYETDLLLEMLERGGYGDDETVDLFFTNYKPTDIVGHRYNINSEEMGDVLQAQDEALGHLVDWLDDNVKDYVVVVSSDHGNTVPAEDSGGWPLLQGQLQLDVNDHFNVDDGRSLITQTTAVGPFLDHATMKETGVTAEEIARYLNSYTIGENWAEPELPEGYEDRADEPILSAAFPSKDLPKVMRCAFGKPAPPDDLWG
ncbi:MAG: alkaline phosphatase family protein [Actinomycetota bacterium]